MNPPYSLSRYRVMQLSVSALLETQTLHIVQSLLWENLNQMAHE